MCQQPRGRYSRGYIPHIDAGRDTQFITWRLADSLPAFMLAKWKQDVQHLPQKERQRQLHLTIDEHLDKGFGSQILRNPVASKIVQDSLIFGHPDRYDLCSWVVMPTHVHCLLSPKDGWSLSQIMKSLKGFTSREIGKALNMPGKLWQEEPFDVLIRDDEHFNRVWKYIEWNPVKAGLCADPKDWPYSSANELAWLRVETKSGGLDQEV